MSQPSNKKMAGRLRKSRRLGKEFRKIVDYFLAIVSLIYFILHMETYYTFLRSAKGWEDFAKARKIVQDKGLTREEARAQCKEYNDNRDARQIEAGTKMEFDSE